jgi:Fe-S-cluster-containing hydrogenase component 2
MAKTLVVDYEKCHGCGQCQAACEMAKETNTGVAHPRITAFHWDLEGWGTPIICQHCQDAPCKAACLLDAIYRDEDLDRVMINYDRCIGCRMCVSACPFGAMNYTGEVQRVVKCDLCEGDPICATFCSYGALQYVHVEDQSVQKKIETAEILKLIRQGA